MNKFNNTHKPCKVLKVLVSLQFSLPGFLFKGFLSENSLLISLPYSLLMMVMNANSPDSAKNKSCQTIMFNSFSCATWGARTPDLMIKSQNRMFTLLAK